MFSDAVQLTRPTLSNGRITEINTIVSVAPPGSAGRLGSLVRLEGGKPAVAPAHALGDLYR